MSNRLAFQTQLASIMEVLANAAVAEICKLVDDDYAVVSLQMSQCQRENKALKRKLHLLELKMARGNAERRLRESAMNGGRARVQLNINDRLRINSPSTAGAEFETQMAVVQWHGRSTLEGNTNKLSHSNIPQSKSPDVELVQPDLLLVKEERVDLNMVQLENMDGDQPLIGSDGVVEHVSRGAAGHRAELKELNKQCCFTNQTSRNSRAEEDEEPDVVLVKVEDGETELKIQNQTSFSIQEGLVESSTGNQMQETNQCFSESSGLLSTLGLPGDSGGFKAERKPSNDNTVPLAQQTSALRTDYSMVELETILTHWAPDVQSPSSPSCSFTTQEAGGEEDVIIVKSEPPSDSTLTGSNVKLPEAATSLPAGQAMNTSQPQWRINAMKNRRANLHHQSYSKTIVDGLRAQTSSSTLVIADPISSTSSNNRVANSIAASQYPLTMGGPAAGLSRLRYGGLLARNFKHQTDYRRKGFVCGVCGKAFPGQSNLEAHQRVHTGEKPFHCDTCGKQFSEAGNLKKHQRVHTGEKPYCCDNCGKRFAWICNLRTHQMSATCCNLHVQGGLGSS